MNNQRRVFMIQSVAAGGLLAVSTMALAQKPEMVKDTDANAVSLGYKADGTKTDTKKYTKYAAGQNCSNCALFQGKEKDAAGGCPLFAGKQVAAKGWCSAWAKKA